MFLFSIAQWFIRFLNCADESSWIKEFIFPCMIVSNYLEKLIYLTSKWGGNICLVIPVKNTMDKIFTLLHMFQFYFQ